MLVFLSLGITYLDNFKYNLYGITSCNITICQINSCNVSLYNITICNVTSNAINILERKISGKGAVRAGKGFNLFILNQNKNGIKIRWKIK